MHIVAITLGFFCVAASASAGNPFGPAVLASGDNPQRVAVGDIDGDGKRDIASAHGDGTVRVYRGSGGGEFLAPVILASAQPSPNGFAGLELVDVDGDADLDLIALMGLFTTSNSAAKTCVWIHQGGFVFSAVTVYASGNFTAGMGVGDVDGDGRPEIAVSNFGGASRVVLLMNSGSGSYAVQQSLALPGAFPYDAAIGDVDADGDADIVTTNENATLAVLTNLGGGVFAAPVFHFASGQNRKILLADLDNDGDVDALVTTLAGSVIAHWNNGAGAFASPTVVGSAGTQPHELAVGDLDGDGRLDVAYSDFQRGLHTVLNLGGGVFAPQFDQYGAAQYGLALGDVDGDARVDLVLARDQADQIGILGGDGSGGFGRTRIVLGSGLRDFRRADLDGDGRMDLVGADSVAGVRVRLALPAGGFGTEATFPVAAASMSVWVGRVDADTFQDVLVLGNDNTLRVLPGNGAGAFGAATSAATSITSMDAADFNADGFLDIVLNFSFLPPGFPAPIQGAQLRLNDGTGVFTTVADAPNQVTSYFSIGDMNADGAQDVVRYYGGQVTGWISNGAGGFVLKVYSTSATGATVADLNEDGNLDVVQFGPSQLLPGDGAGNVGAPLSITGPVASLYRDVNGDGHVDGIAISSGISVYERTAPLTYVDRGAVPNVGSSTGTPTWADYDGDGRADLWLSTFTPSGVFVLENRGPMSGPVVYCTAKITSNGCVPAIGWSGVSSASASSGFTISSTSSINNAPGLLAYSPSGRMNVPFQGGTLCVGPIIFRGPILLSGGNPGPMDCSGVYTLDFNAFAQGLAGGAPIPTLVVPGTSVTAQWYGRDAFSIGGASLSNAIDFVVGP